MYYVEVVYKFEVSKQSFNVSSVRSKRVVKDDPYSLLPLASSTHMKSAFGFNHLGGLVEGLVVLAST